MIKKSSSPKENELMFVLDYIMNRASIREIDALSEAVLRRKQRLESETGMISLNPGEAAKKMSESVEESIQMGMEGVRSTFREFAADLLRKEAPELSPDQAAALLESWIPEQASFGKQKKKKVTIKKDVVNGIPADALYEMILQFVSYSIGEMSKEDQKELQASMGNWAEVYWKRFPRDIQHEIKAFLDGQTTSGEFQRAIQSFLS